MRYKNMLKGRAIQPSFWRDWAFSLALIACTLRALVPAGFMADTQSGGGHLITICSGSQGEAHISINPDGTPFKEHKKSHEQPCGFSVNLSCLSGNGSIVGATPILINAVMAVLPDPFITHYKTCDHSSRAPPRF